MALNALHEVAAGVPGLMKIWIYNIYTQFKSFYLLGAPMVPQTWFIPRFHPKKNQGFKYRASYGWTQKSCGGPLELMLTQC